MAAYNVLQDILKISRYSRFSSRSSKYISFSRHLSSKEVSVEVQVAGRPLKLSSGKFAFLADGATVVQYGGTAVLATATSSPELSGNDSLAFVVDYKEKASSTGLIPSTFHRREHGLKESEVTISRCIDRSLRPLFEKGYFYDIQVLSNLFAFDKQNIPDIVALNGASTALAISSIPWRGPIGAVRIGELDGEFIVNPLREQMLQSQLDLVVASTESKVVMLEGSAMEMSNERFFEAVKLGFKEAQPIISAIKEIQSIAGKGKREYKAILPSEEMHNAVYNFASDKINEIFSNSTYKKLERDNQIFTLRDDCFEEFQEGSQDDFNCCLTEQAFHNVCKDVLKKNIFEQKKRCDGRSVCQLRDIKCEVNLFDNLHGSALFNRGETQVLSILTIGSINDAAKQDAISVALSGSDDKKKKFMLQYEFPPFSTNETRDVSRGLRRRDIGHGMLSEKALVPVLPKELNCTMRLTCQVLASNGSSSMASACAGSLAMKDAGVSIQKLVAGTACGLVTSEDGNDPDKADIDEYQILTDILGIEDHLGEMDFKVTGTRDGITAIQVDVKIPGLPLHIIEEALKQSSEDRNKVLDIMDEALVDAKTCKENCPISETITIPATKRASVIGPGGMGIKRLENDYGIGLTQVDGERYILFAPNKALYDLAMSKINALIYEKSRFQELASRLEKGSVYEGKIVDIKNYGVLVEVFPDCPTVLIHSRNLDHRKVSPEELGFQIEDTVKFKYIGMDAVNDRVICSRIALRDSQESDDQYRPVSFTKKHSVKGNLRSNHKNDYYPF